MIAVLVVVVLFVKVLEQFGLLETGYDGKEKGEMWGTDLPGATSTERVVNDSELLVCWGERFVMS